MAYASSVGENACLSGGLAAAATYMGINTGTPPGTNTVATEVTGGSPAYARQAITWGTPASGAMSNATTTLTFNVPAEASPGIQTFSLWNTATISGSTGLVLGGNLTAAQIFSTQGTFSIAPGGLTVSIS